MQPYGIMFHHFHNKEHIMGQGSISSEQLEDIILYTGPENILPAREWMIRALSGSLKENHVCLTFDDNLKCQYDVAYPVLEKYDLTAFWFVYTSPLVGVLENLEIYRYFRFAYFSDVDSFYSDFWNTLFKSPYADSAKEGLRYFSPKDYLTEFAFYTDNDRTFRFLRDKVLGPEKYNDLMDFMMTKHKIKKESLRTKLWMSGENLQDLNRNGHVIGLHTHTHPTSVASLTREEQLEQYSTNKKVLTDLLGIEPVAMSHPCNSYNKHTLDVLSQLGISIGFRANMAQSRSNFTAYEFPREDHVNVLKEMVVKV